MILSASRRTDIPAFYADWLLRRFREGWLLVRHPMNPHQLSRVALSPELVDAIVFWTKDPTPMLARLADWEALGIPFLFQFTLTPYGEALEPGVRDKRAIADTFCRLADKLGPHRVLWRYDPVVLNDSWTVARHEEAFAALCERLKGYTDQCTVSFVDLYAGLRGAQRAGLLRVVEADEMARLAASFAREGGRAAIAVRACCEAMDLRPFGVEPASCIDRKRLEALCGCSLRGGRASGQRPGCGCMDSVDVGAYGTCRHGCVYCYAARSGVPPHDPASPLLSGWPAEDDRILERRMVPLQDGQTSLFG